jgi:hypothetical protein
MESLEQFMMSYYAAPITNKVPSKNVSLFEVYLVIRSGKFEPQTIALRALEGKDERRAYKGGHFDYVSPSGIFSYCNDASLVRHSGILCMDLDDLGTGVDEMKGKLLSDPIFDTLLMFRSPGGEGLKWFTEIDLTRCDHRTWFAAIRNYLMVTYGLTEKQVDKSCSNPSKACFLCYDPDVYIKTELIEYF